MNETFGEFVKTLTGGASIRAIAEQAGLGQSTLNRQINGDAELKVQTVVAICRAYKGNLLQAFVAAGYITQQEAESLAAVAGVAKATDTELAEEILRRVRSAEASHPALTTPIAIPGSDDSVTIEHKQPVSQGGNPDDIGFVRRANEDLSELSEDRIKSNYATAANSDTSAEGLDQEGS